MGKRLNYCPVFGNYPKEYNRAVHGPYYPWVNYGPRDTPFYEVKLGDLKGWIMRRNKTPQAVIATVSRYAWLWQHRWGETRFGSLSKPVFQAFVIFSFTSMILTYERILRPHRSHKYHW